MKMVKSLLLGTAAGLVAMTGAQAADLPVKAKPVQYVKICSLYGAGFYYIPGTDMCLKIGGWVRAEYAYGMNGSMGGPPVGGNVNNRSTNDSVMRARGYITADARNQTEYGTVRSYIAIGTSGSDRTGVVNETAATGQVFDANRAFIQFAGFTFGITQSFYDFYNFAATGYIPDFYSDTGDSGWKSFAYTAQFGNGFSASIAAEMRRTTQLVNEGATSAVAGAIVGGGVTVANGYGGFRMPDVIGNLRVDQAWGSAQVMGAVHQVNSLYYSSSLLENSVNTNPADAYGFAVGGGIKILAPMIGAGDYFQTQVNYTQGALRYLFVAGPANPYIGHGASGAYGVLADGVFGSTGTGLNGTSVQLTTGWGVNAAYEHFWSPHWQTSVHGGYLAVSYNSQANAMLCVLEGGANGTGSGSTAVATAGCDNNWQAWAIGSRTQWNVDSQTSLGLDVAYTRVQSASSATGFIPTAVVPATTIGPKTADDDNVWSARFRVHRNFYP
jgi:hypothetical protein